MQLAMARVGAKTHILQQISMLDLGRILRFVVHQFFKLLIDEKLLVNRSRRVRSVEMGSWHSFGHSLRLMDKAW